MRYRDELIRIKRIFHGYYVYKKIKNKYSSQNLIFVAPFDGLGDSYLLCKYLKQYAEDQTFCLTVVGSGNSKIAKLFHISNIEVITQYDSDSLCYFSIFSNEKVKIKILHYDPFDVNHIGILMNMRGVNHLNYAEMIAYNVFNLTDFKTPVLPDFNALDNDIKKYLKEAGIVKNKSVIIAPYANSMPTMPLWVWEQLVTQLCDKGYTVFTNIAKKEDYILKGSLPIEFSLDVAGPVVEYAGYFIGIRSGLCDVISSSDCKKIIIHQPFIKWGNSTSFNYFNLKAMGLSEDAIELEYIPDNYWVMLTSLSDYFTAWDGEVRKHNYEGK